MVSFYRVTLAWPGTDISTDPTAQGHNRYRNDLSTSCEPRNTNNRLLRPKNTEITACLACTPFTSSRLLPILRVPQLMQVTATSSNLERHPLQHGQSGFAR
ncbi:hypothetical protein Cob_v005138 [Colletotrichum orbiculare MAFF 240422]|uniref:Uncharacterized protein n=1 Tax=Colletotrichum orbiculare (strain 104-T / ATCC 96160 / CBS 514.97 / LARS 414 / MAFF 240422) TaxID=1213857 RepID=A0A484FYR7_COLOR|nr:hypothetical protein Cob_v005138 [Colletotrichum orbiculare MAFF 240422]